MQWDKKAIMQVTLNAGILELKCCSVTMLYKCLITFSTYVWDNKRASDHSFTLNQLIKPWGCCSMTSWIVFQNVPSIKTLFPPYLVWHSEQQFLKWISERKAFILLQLCGCFGDIQYASELFLFPVVLFSCKGRDNTSYCSARWRGASQNRSLTKYNFKITDRKHLKRNW